MADWLISKVEVEKGKALSPMAVTISDWEPFAVTVDYDDENHPHKEWVWLRIDKKI